MDARGKHDPGTLADVQSPNLRHGTADGGQRSSGRRAHHHRCRDRHGGGWSSAAIYQCAPRAVADRGPLARLRRRNRRLMGQRDGWRRGDPTQPVSRLPQ